MGGKLVVAGEAEVGAPWTPASVQCDSYCQMRIRNFIEPLAVITPELELEGWLAESIEPNEDATVFTIKLRPGITFTDGTALTAEVAVDNLNRTWTGLLVGGAMRDIAKNADGTVAATIVDDLTFTLPTGKNGNIDEPVSWHLFPYYLAGQPGFVASSQWLAAVDADRGLATQPVGTGPFVVTQYPAGRPDEPHQEPELLAFRRGRQQAAVPRRARVPGDHRLAGPGPGARVRRRRPDRHLRPQRRHQLRRQRRLRDAPAERADRDELHPVPPHPAAVAVPRGALRAACRRSTSRR